MSRSGYNLVTSWGEKFSNYNELEARETLSVCALSYPRVYLDFYFSNLIWFNRDGHWQSIFASQKRAIGEIDLICSDLDSGFEVSCPVEGDEDPVSETWL